MYSRTPWSSTLKKAASNLTKHGIAFADVEPVFYDERALTIDSDFDGEVRHVTVGTDALGRVIAVVWTKRGSTHRVISARVARRNERASYED